MMSRITVVIKRNAGYEKGVFGLSIHDEPGGAATVEAIESEAALRERLLGFGMSEDYAKDVIGRLKEKHDSVKIEIDAPRRTK